MRLRVAMILFGIVLFMSRPARSEHVPVFLSGETVELPGNLPAYVPFDSAQFMGNADLALPIILYIPFKIQNREALDSLLQELDNPISPLYAKWLTPSEFRDRFGPAVEQYDAVSQFLQTHGWKLEAPDPLRKSVKAHGTAGMVQETFGVPIKTYAKGELTFYANDANPQVPLCFLPLIDGVFGLDDYPAGVTNVCQNPGAATQCGAGLGWTPTELSKIYDFASCWSNGVDGTGQKIGIVGIQFGALSQATINTFFSQYGMTAPTMNYSVVAGTPNGSGSSEGYTDVETASVVAKGSTSVYVYDSDAAGSDLLQAFTKAVSDDICKTVSSSWGIVISGGGGTAFEQSFETQAVTAQSQGQTMIASTGDSAYTCPQLPAECLHVLGVGGTRVQEDSSTGAWCSETGWVESCGTCKSGAGATVWVPSWTRPSWQAGPGLPSTSSVNYRLYPDVSAMVQTCLYNGSWGGYYGTSIACPMWNGFLAIVNTGRAKVGLGTAGFVTDTFYSWLRTPPSPAPFHDVTTSSTLSTNAGNTCNGFAGGGPAGTGWDWITGIGSPDVCHIVTLLAPGGSPTATPSATGTATSTVSRTATATALNSATPTTSATTTGTVSSTVTPTVTQTRSATVTVSSSVTATVSGTPTNSPTITNTSPADFTPSPTSTSVPTATATSTSSASPTTSSTNTPISTGTFTSTSSNTVTLSFTVTRTASPTPAFTPTLTYTYTRTASLTFTRSETLTPTFTPLPTGTPSHIVAAPNPLSLSALGAASGITFWNAPPSTRIRVYTVSGELVTEAQSGSLGGPVAWDLTNRSNTRVSPGLYYFLATPPGEPTQKGVLILQP